MAEGNHRLNTIAVQLGKHGVVEHEACLVGFSIISVREDAAPCNTHAETFEAHFRREGDVLFVVMAEVDCLVAGIVGVRQNGAVDWAGLPKGILLSVLPIPLGCLAGGLMMGLPLRVLLLNLSPILLLTVFLLAGLLFFPQKLLRGFRIFNRGISSLAVLGLIAGAVEYLTGVSFLPGAEPILDAFVIPGRIAVMLMGCLPLLEILFKLTHRQMEAVGRRLGGNAKTLEALLLITTTAIPAFPMLQEMPPKGKAAVIAWMVGTMGLLTSHYGFAMGVEPAVCIPQAAAKFMTGCIALGIALAIPSSAAFYRSIPVNHTDQVKEKRI